MTKWQDWEIDEGIWDPKVESPYVSWWRTQVSPGQPAIVLQTVDRDLNFSEWVETQVDMFAYLVKQLPDGAGLPEAQDRTKWSEAPIRATPPPPGTPIVGVIDDGIALSHRQFLGIDGSTRILTAWQQSAQWGAPLGIEEIDETQTHLPFGNELYLDDIDDLIAAHTTDTDVDEDAFNRAAGALDMQSQFGQRMLNTRAAHGTHVADIAGGNSEAGLVFVNLPSRANVGLSGTFVEQLLMLGILRIVSVADKLWQDAGYEARSDGMSGYPIVINMSFSKMAGARGALTELGLFLYELNKRREEENLSKVYFVFPAGNDNLLKGVGRVASLAPEKTHTFEMDVPPEDQSSSYVEIWTRYTNNKFLPQEMLAIAIEGPGDVAPWEVPSFGEDGYFASLDQEGGTVARVYSSNKSIIDVFRYSVPIAPIDFLSIAEEQEEADFIQRYVLAMSPSLSHDKSVGQFPAGRWKITVKNVSEFSQQVVVSVQSDQSAVPGGRIAGRPHLVDPYYEDFDQLGRRKDSYDPETSEYSDTDEAHGQVFRHGTLNAMASAGVYATRDHSMEPQNSILIAAGYRASDDHPAQYSSTGVSASGGAGSLEPHVAFPTDDGATLLGILASGSRDGSKVAYRGTSFAAAQATREIAKLLTSAGATSHGYNAIDQLMAMAAPNMVGHATKQVRTKLGQGRVPRSGANTLVNR